MDVTSHVTSRATIYAFTHEDGRREVVAVPPGSSIATVLDAIRDQVNALEARLKPLHRTAELRDNVIPRLASRIAKEIENAKTESRDIAAAEAVMLEPLPGDSALYSEYRQAFKAMTLAEKVTFVANANLQQTSAILIGGWSLFPEVPDRVRAVLEERHMLLGHVRRTNLQTSHQKQPSADDPLANGPDEAAALAAAREGSEVHRARREALVLVRSSIRSVIRAVALVTGLSPNDAFTLFSGVQK